MQGGGPFVEAAAKPDCGNGDGVCDGVGCGHIPCLDIICGARA